MTKPQRYGTSAAPRPDGIFCLYAEYEKLVAECERLRTYQMFGALLALEEAVRAQRAMYEGTSDEDNMSARSIGDAIAKLDAARKEKA